MSRIHITGNAGSGKTTLAKQIGEALGLPVYGLDMVVWQSGWEKTPTEERQEKEEELVSRPDWVIEGVSKTVRDAADVVIFLDVPRCISFLRCVKRNWKYLFQGRPELPENCPEIRIIPQLVKIIWNFPKRVRPKIIEDIKGSTKQSYIVRSGKEMSEVLSFINSQA